MTASKPPDSRGDSPPRRWTRRELFNGTFLKWLVAGDPESATTTEEATAAPGPLLVRFPKSGSEVRSTRGPKANIPVLRPPGAIEESEFLRRCDSCGDCLEACPYDAIIQAPVRLRSAAGTPVIDPIQQPCWLCADTPCITSCTRGALQSTPTPVMGTAQIFEGDCLAHQGSFCTSCSERCPVEGAIALDQQRPRIDGSTCIGCGVCQHVCPAPHNAVLLMPALQRPSGTPIDDQSAS